MRFNIVLAAIGASILVGLLVLVLRPDEDGSIAVPPWDLRYPSEGVVKLPTPPLLRGSAAIYFPEDQTESPDKPREEPKHQESEDPPPEDPPPVHSPISVSTTRELVEALGSDRTIQLVSERYDFEDSDATEPVGCLVEGVKNLILHGIWGTTVKLVVPSWWNTVEIRDSENVELVNLELGHDGKRICQQDCLVIRNSKDIRIRECALVGCGRTGLRAEGTTNLTVEDTTITECDIAVHISKSEIVWFIRCEISRNRFLSEQILFLHENRNVVLDLCSVSENWKRFDQQLGCIFSVVPASTVVMRGGDIARNHALHLANREDAVRFEGVSIGENKFYKGRYPGDEGK